MSADSLPRQFGHRELYSDVSVIIPILNGEAWLHQQLEALACDTHQPFQTVVADNGSIDNSLAIANSFSSRMRLLTVDASKQPGQSFARNVGAQASSGSALLFLDQDDVIAPGYVTAMAAGLRHAEIVVARMDGEALNPGWRRHARELPQTYGLPVDPVPWGYGGTLGIRRNAFQQLGGFTEELGVPAGEDVDLCWRAHALKLTVAFAPDAVVHYRFPSTLSAFLRQGHSYGSAGIVIAARNGVPAPRLAASVRAVFGPLRLAVLGPSKGDRARGIFLLGRRIGTLQASLKQNRKAFSIRKQRLNLPDLDYGRMFDADRSATSASAPAPSSPGSSGTIDL